jgi:hypothetical protein
MNAVPIAHRCAHAPCVCEVPLHQTYCSDHCSTQAALGEAHPQCECGHAGCCEPALPAPSEPA